MNNQFKIHLCTEIQYLKGVGPKRGKFLNDIGIHHVKDLLRNFPRKYLDRTNIKSINQIKINEKVVIIGTIESFGVKRLKPGRPKGLKRSGIAIEVKPNGHYYLLKTKKEQPQEPSLDLSLQNNGN